MPIYNLTQDKIDEFNEKLQNKEQELEKLKTTNNKEMWISELDDLDNFLKKNKYETRVKTKLIKKLKK